MARVYFDDVLRHLTEEPVRPMSHPPDLVAEARAKARDGDPHCAALVSLIDQRNATIKELTTARVQPRSELLDAALAACGVLTDLAIGNAVAVSEKYARTLRTRLWNAVMDAKEER